MQRRAEALREETRRLNAGSRLPGLDALRGLAILMVLVHHAVQVVPLPWPRLQAAATCGWAGVDLFFALSGFLITGILLDARDDRQYFRNFYMRRVLRIFPLYYGVLAVSLVLVLAVPHVQWRRHLRLEPWLWLYGTNFKIAMEEWYPFRFGRVRLDHFWTLAVEEHFYLIWPLVVRACSRRRLAWVCAGLLVFCPLLRWWYAARGEWVAAYVLTGCRADALAAGALGAILARGSSNPGHVRRGAGIAAVILLLATAWFAAGTGFLDRFRLSTATIGFSLLPIWFAACVVWAAGVGRFSGIAWLVGLPLVVLGQYSYGLYVFHHMIRDLLPINWLLRGVHSQWLGAAIFFAAEVGASFVIAFISWHLYEKQFLKLKRYFAPGRGPNADVVAAIGSVPQG